MATWGDVVSLIITLSLFVGAIMGAMFVSKQMNASLETTKKDLHKKGLSVSSSGVSIKTSGRYTREDYIDSTQRAFINGMAVMKQAGSFGHADDIEKPTPSSPTIVRSPSSSRQNSLSGGYDMRSPQETSRKNSLPLGTHVTNKAPSSPIPTSPAAPRRTMSANGTNVTFTSGGSPPSPPEEKKKKIANLFSLKAKRDSKIRGTTPTPI